MAMDDVAEDNVVGRCKGEEREALDVVKQKSIQVSEYTWLYLVYA